MSDGLELVLATSWVPNRAVFLEVMGVSPGGLGEYFLGAVYNAIFVASLEVKNEFNKYYSIEYGTLKQYMLCRYGVSLGDEELGAEKIFLVQRLPQIISRTYEDNKLDTVLGCIKKLGEAKHEDKV